jgi:hypothetical protein
VKLLRTIRLDPSDTFVFAKAAEAGEWAVPGSFMFISDRSLETEIEAMGPKQRSAFRSGFLGVTSFGWSTLAIVTLITEAEHAALLTEFATALMRELGAPDIATACAAAAEEIAFAASLCDHPENTLIAVHRSVEDGELRERFRTLRPRAEALGPDAPKGGFRAFDFFEVAEGDDEIVEDVDLAALMKAKAPEAAP